MKFKQIAAVFLTSAVVGTLSMGSAFAYEKCHKSKWGPDDQIGAINNITKDNILHTTYRRNPHLIRILHDLKLMEGEGTGYNLIYEITSRDAKAFPIPISAK